MYHFIKHDFVTFQCDHNDCFNQNHFDLIKNFLLLVVVFA